MGIAGLWQVVSPSGEARSFMQLTATEGLRRSERRYIKVGIDMSFWIDQCQAAFQSAMLHTHAGENPELRACFYRLCHLLKYPVVPVFVADGPSRPSQKRGRAVSGNSLWMSAYMIQLIEAFGFHFHQAPGEAEAELARLNELDVIDMIITDDSDVLVFGGQCVVRGFSNKSDKVVIYSADAIEFTTALDKADLRNSVGLTRGGLLLFALLSGGDYDRGVAGCGGNIARGLAQCGFGDSLLAAATSLSPQQLDVFLRFWRNSIRDELRSNSQGRLRGRHPALSLEIDDTFPKPETLDKYLNPVTSWTLGSGSPPPNGLSWRIREPTIQLIADFCTKHFGWSSGVQISEKFSRNLWEGVACRILYSPLLVHVDRLDGTQKFATPKTNMVVLSQSNSRSILSSIIPMCRLKISTSNFRECIGRMNSEVTPQVTFVTVPRCFLEPRTKPTTPASHNNSLATEYITVTDGEDSDEEVEIIREFIDLT